MSGNSNLGAMADRIGPLVPSTPEQIASVRRHIDRQARDEDDRVMLLEAIGLEAAK